MKHRVSLNSSFGELEEAAAKIHERMKDGSLDSQIPSYRAPPEKPEKKWIGME
jgi:hypothetical protein